MSKLILNSNTMKKIIYCLLATCLSFTFLPLQSVAATTEKPSSLTVTKAPEPVESVEVRSMLKRMDGLNTVDKTTLSSNNKKNKQVEITTRHHHGYGYISVGALVLIILLIVILL